MSKGTPRAHNGFRQDRWPALDDPDERARLLRLELKQIRADEELREMRERAEKHIRADWPLGDLAQAVVQLVDRVRELERRLAQVRQALGDERRARRRGGNRG